jgi:hypothetical protein
VTRAQRQRRYRARQRQGRSVVRVDVNAWILAEALMARGKLTESQALDRELLARAIGEHLDEWAATVGT